jgi:hypothetical protein
MRKSTEELEKINTKNLLRYYRAERKRYYKSGYICDCGCGDYVWEGLLHKDYYVKLKEKHDNHNTYLEKIKGILNSREHITK